MKKKTFLAKLDDLLDEFEDAVKDDFVDYEYKETTASEKRNKVIKFVQRNTKMK